MYTAYGIVTLYEWPWWSYGTQVERDYMNYDYMIILIKKFVR